MNSGGKVLIIDDEIGPRESLRMIIKDKYPVKTAPNALEGLKLLSEDDFSVVLLDLRMPHMDGITALQEIKRICPDSEVLIVTAYASVDTARKAIQYGAFDYLMKPFDRNDVIKVVERGMHKRKKAKELKQEHTELKELIDERTKELMITERMRKELFENANDGIIIMNTDAVILDLNLRACELMGYAKEELKGEKITTFEAEESKYLWKDRMVRLLNGEQLLFETEYYTKSGNKVSIEISAKAIEVDGRMTIQSFYRDITEKKRLQAQLFHSQKMESIGTLAGGLAHDFNNILTAVLGHADMILATEQLSTGALESLQVIESSARQASQVVAQLLSFARRGGNEFNPLRVNEVIENTLAMVSKLILPRIIIKKKLDATIVPIMGNATQIGQVVMNLVINARDAIPNGGEIDISTGLVNVKPGSLPNSGLQGGPGFHADIKEGQFIVIRISDTGTGIAEEHLPHIFEPFYTTKEKGKGTGLGLAASYGIVKDHGGEITVYSKAGFGTIVAIYLPVPK